MKTPIFFAIVLNLLFLNNQTVLMSIYPKDAPSDCEQRLENLSLSACRIVIALEDRPELQGPFKSVQEVDEKYCSRVPGYINSFTAYKQCLKAFPRQILSLLISSTKTTYKTFCSKTGKMALINHSKCFDKQTIGGVKLAMNKAVVAVEYILTNATENELIPGICCAANVMVVEGTKDINRICNNITRKQTGTYLINAVMGSLRYFLDFICAKYSTIEDCESESPKLTSRIREVINRNQPYYNQSYFVSLIDFVHRMD